MRSNTFARTKPKNLSVNNVCSRWYFAEGNDGGIRLNDS